jgi:hypothetical protein
MPTEPEVSPSLRTWQVKSWRELRAAWSELVPAPDESGAVERWFRGQILTPQDAGAVFERWILEAFRLSGVNVHDAYGTPLAESALIKEQIDGFALEGWQGFLIESKFWVGKVDFDPIALLHVLVEQRPAGTLGLFFSAFDYTAAALESAAGLRPIRVLLFDQKDLVWAMQRRRGMMELVRERWTHAVKYGRPYVRNP